jgi:hypothetical protein
VTELGTTRSGNGEFLTGKDQGFDTVLSGCDGTGPLHHSPEACRPSHYWCRVSLSLLFSMVGPGWMGLSQSFCQVPTFDLSQTHNTLRELCNRSHASTDCGDGKMSWVPVQHDLWSLVPCSQHSTLCRYIWLTWVIYMSENSSNINIWSLKCRVIPPNNYFLWL